MRITRIDIEGQTGRYATIKRRIGSSTIEVEILTPDCPDGKIHAIDAKADETTLWRAANDLHHALEGHPGTNCDVHDYYREIQRLAD